MKPNHLVPAEYLVGQVATVRPQVGLSQCADFEHGAVFRPAETQEKSLNVVLDHLAAWSGALRAPRKKSGQL